MYFMKGGVGGGEGIGFFIGIKNKGVSYKRGFF